MSYKFDEFPESTVDERRVGPPCAKGDACDHASVEECDKHRQSLLEAEHKKTCKHIEAGQPCTHFGSAVRAGAIPNTARYQGMSPAEYVLWSRGLKSNG